MRAAPLGRIAAVVVLASVAIGGRAIAGAATEAAPPLAGLPPDTPQEGSPEREALRAFQRDPAGNARALLRLGTGSIDRLPVALLLAVADVHLRTGRHRSAGRFFAEVVRREPGEPWTTYAELGLGWSTLARGGYALAEQHYRRVRTPRELATIAEVMLGWTAALGGRSDEAVEALDRAAHGTALGNVRHVALLGAGYARYWAGWYEDAAETFARFARIAPGSPLADDARYAEAWSLLRARQRTRALAALAALAGEGSAAEPPRAAVSRAQLELAPAAVVRGRRTDGEQISGFEMPDVRMVAMLDRDGVALARGALALLGRDEAGTAESDAPAAAPAGAHERAEPAAAAAVRAHPQAARGAAAGSRMPGMLLVWAIAAAAVVLATLTWRPWRRPPGA